MNANRHDTEQILREAGERWKIARPAGMWSALYRSDDGRHIHYIVVATAPELAQRILIAESEE
jgi:hypothetical protein